MTVITSCMQNSLTIRVCVNLPLLNNQVMNATLAINSIKVRANGQSRTILCSKAVIIRSSILIKIVNPLYRVDYRLNQSFLQQYDFLMSNQRLTLVRLEKEQRSLEKDPIPNFLVKRKGQLDFHFCIYGLEGAYKGGFYHGILQLAPDYPFSPPQLKFFTQSGRFEIQKPICTSFTNFHKQEWTSAWNVRTMLLGVLSFMNSPEGGYGSLNQSESKKRQYAAKSLSRNLESSLFKQLFQESLQKMGLLQDVARQSKTIPAWVSSPPVAVENSIVFYVLILLLIVLLFSYGAFKGVLFSVLEL